LHCVFDVGFAGQAFVCPQLPVKVQPAVAVQVDDVVPVPVGHVEGGAHVAV
jgi:hypothetical protein